MSFFMFQQVLQQASKCQFSHHVSSPGKVTWPCTRCRSILPPTPTLLHSLIKHSNFLVGYAFISSPPGKHCYNTKAFTPSRPSRHQLPSHMNNFHLRHVQEQDEHNFSLHPRATIRNSKTSGTHPSESTHSTTRITRILILVLEFHYWLCGGYVEGY